MAPRAVSSGTVSFGLVSIPVKVYTATSSQKVRFNMLEQGTGSRLKQQYLSVATGEVVDRKDTVKGYEVARGQYVIFTPDELKALEADRTGEIEIVEFVQLSAIDHVQIEKSYYLGPDKGGNKPYQLLAEAMLKKDMVAVGRWSARGKEQLVLLRPYRKGLMLHQLFYSDEVRSFDDLDLGGTLDFSELERDLAARLIEQLSVDTFDSSKFRDSYTDKVKALVEQKVAGEESIQVTADAPKAQIIDLFEALKQSLEPTAAPAKAKAPKAKTTPKPLKKAKPRKAPSRKKKSTAS